MRTIFQISHVSFISAEEFPQCDAPNTPRLPPNGVTSQAGYGAPCHSYRPCKPGMSCCSNSAAQLVCEGKPIILILIFNLSKYCLHIKY